MAKVLPLTILLKCALITPMIGLPHEFIRERVEWQIATQACVVENVGGIDLVNPAKLVLLKAVGHFGLRDLHSPGTQCDSMIGGFNYADADLPGAFSSPMLRDAAYQQAISTIYHANWWAAVAPTLKAEGKIDPDTYLETPKDVVDIFLKGKDRPSIRFYNFGDYSYEDEQLGRIETILTMLMPRLDPARDVQISFALAKSNALSLQGYGPGFFLCDEDLFVSSQGEAAFGYEGVMEQMVSIFFRSRARQFFGPVEFSMKRSDYTGTWGIPALKKLEVVGEI